jgi:tetratricopeptide (TPR) repeat protein
VSRVQPYRLFLIAVFAAVATLFFSCSSSKKVSTKFKDVKKVNLNADQKLTEESVYYDATKKKILGEYDQALSLYLQCLYIDPTNAAAYYEVADIMEYDKQPDTALVFIKRAVELEPENSYYENLFAQCLQDKGKYKEVAEVYRTLVKDHPSVPENYYKLAVAEIQANELEQATQTYDLEEQKFGFNEDVSMSKIQVFEKVKNYSGAEAEIEKLMQKNPNTPQYYDMLGNLYEMEGKSDKAFEVYQKMEANSPHDPMVHLSLADYYRTKKDDKKSYDELKLAFEEPSLDMDTKIRIVLSFYGMSNGADTLNMQGLELCQLMIKASPDDPKAHKMYGDFLFRNKDYKDAQEQYLKTLSEDSSKYTIWAQLFATDEIMGDFKGLADASKGAISLFPDYPQTYLANGVANLQLKNYDQALSSLNKGLNYVLDDSSLIDEYYTYIGDANNALKHYDASDSAYETALKYNPNDYGVLNNYGYYLSLRDTELAKAAQMSKKANELVPNNYNYQDTYSWIFYMMGNYQDAKLWEDKALQNGGAAHGDILDHYGDILFKLGSKDEAVNYWQKAEDAGMKNDLLDRKIRDKQLYDK